MHRYARARAVMMWRLRRIARCRTAERRDVTALLDPNLPRGIVLDSRGVPFGTAYFGNFLKSLYTLFQVTRASAMPAMWNRPSRGWVWVAAVVVVATRLLGCSGRGIERSHRPSPPPPQGSSSF